ncbi:peptidase [Sphingomonas oleivorans]|uniref:Peptidase n=1 Tax=Sphingomonas oleivorans TaxID=1735121 RepID=A0A2T5FUJ9_9SPHN|nr:peptidase [Sphingomonas oleivorans]PTQ08205.1 peptidase [Sphingomonas oleivorans]
MTYCVGILVRDGLIMVADTRTNAGIDNISVYRKLHILAESEDRLIVCASAGNLSIAQSVLGQLGEGLPPLEVGDPPRRMSDVPTMFRAAQLVGEAVMGVGRELGPALHSANVDAGIAFLVGGRIGNSPLALYLVYEAGNFIECLPDCPFLQIGATQYGKPILDRALRYDTPLDEAMKVALISFDSTIRSNLSVGLPLDLIAIPTDRSRPVIRRRIETDDIYFRDLSARWSMLLQESRATIPDPPFMAELSTRAVPTITGNKG